MDILQRLPQDKLLHLVTGLLVYMAFHFINPLFALVAAAAVGVGKEIYDHLHKDKHTPDMYDAIATAAGGIVGFICGL